MRLVALKLNWNDGGASGTETTVGYRAVCSAEAIKYNISTLKAAWCRNRRCPCRKFHDGRYESQPPSTPDCYESKLRSARGMVFSSGVYSKGKKRGKSIPVKNVAVGDVALLTTVFPSSKKKARKVFGCFRLRKPRPTRKSGVIFESDGKMDIIFPDKVAKRLSFWTYHGPNRNGTYVWGSGLFRYVRSRPERFFRDLFRLLGSCRTRDRLIAALPEFRQLGKRIRARK